MIGGGRCNVGSCETNSLLACIGLKEFLIYPKIKSEFVSFLLKELVIHTLSTRQNMDELMIYILWSKLFQFDVCLMKH